MYVFHCHSAILNNTSRWVRRKEHDFFVLNVVSHSSIRRRPNDASTGQRTAKRFTQPTHIRLVQPDLPPSISCDPFEEHVPDTKGFRFTRARVTEPRGQVFRPPDKQKACGPGSVLQARLFRTMVRPSICSWGSR